MEKSENGLSNLISNRLSSAGSLTPNLQQLRSDLANNNTNNLNSASNTALMNAFGFAGLPLQLGLWDNQLISAAMSQYMEVNNSLLNLKQNIDSSTSLNGTNQNSNSKHDEEDSFDSKQCNKSDVLDLKINNNSNKRLKMNETNLVSNNQQSNSSIKTKSSLSKDLSYLDNGKSYPCPECHKTFATEVDLKAHLLRHVMQHPFCCSTCGKGFKYDHTLDFHMKSNHGVEANNKLNLKNMNKKNSNVKNENIDDKSIRKSNKVNKQQHFNQDNLEEDDLNNNISPNLLAGTSKHQTNQNTSSHKQLFSSQIDFGFPNSTMPNLGIQMKSEKVLIVMLEGINPLNDQAYTLYKCNICGYAFANLAPVTEHVLTVHSNQTKFNCDKCGANFKWRNELIVHDQIHKAMEQQQSNQCDKFILPPLMQHNLMLMNQYFGADQRQNKLDNNNNDNNLTINNNNNNLNGNNSLVTNPINGHSDLNSGLNLSKNTRKDSESSQESLCQSKLNKNRQSKELRSEDIDELSKNITVVKENITNALGEIEETAPGQFKCRYCEKTFDRVFSVHRHERVHTGFKPCICKVCGRGFSEKRNLRHHIIRFHSDGSGRELLRRVRKDKGSNNEDNSEAKRQLKAMEMNILTMNNNSFQSNIGSDEDLPPNSFMNVDEKFSNDDLTSNNDENNSDQNEFNKKTSSSRRRKSVPYKKITDLNSEQNDTEEEEKDDNSSRSDQASVKLEDDDDTLSNNDEHMNLDETKTNNKASFLDKISTY